MKIRKIIVALAAVLVPFLVFRVGSGLTEQQNVTLRDYTVSENEKTLTLHAAVFPPIEDIWDYKDEPKNGEHYLTFYNAFGSANIVPLSQDFHSPHCSLRTSIPQLLNLLTAQSCDCCILGLPTRRGPIPSRSS